MREPSPKNTCSSSLGSFLVLAALVFVIYGNTLHSPWILDDFDNIISDGSIHLEHLDAASLRMPLKSTLESGRLDRPLARLSFALNWYAGGDNPWGFHVVNICIHALCAYLIFLTVSVLHRTPKGGAGSSGAFAASLMAAALWAANPLQTQAVTYIVQRMAAMAGLFYLFGLYCFIRGRLSEAWTGRALWWCGCLGGFLLGVASKENAVLLPFALLLTEIVFFRAGQSDKKVGRLLTIVVPAVAVCVLAGVYLVTKGNPLSLFNYEFRYFSLEERLLTQPRVLLFYLSQLFFPAPFRLSIEHDFAVSTSVFHPWTTLPSIGCIFILIGVALKKYRSWPYFSFAVLFFFLNHAIESSLVPLELVFEHRNYLPSMFLFVPLARGLSIGLEYDRLRRRSMFWVAAGSAVFLILGLGIGTHVRNLAWESPESLWADAVRKAPTSSRALAYLAMHQSGYPDGDERALRLYQAALGGTKTNKQIEPQILNNMAAVHYAKGDYEQAARHWQKVLDLNPGSVDARYRLALACLKANRGDEALAHLDRLVSGHTKDLAARNLRGVVFFKKGQFESAMREFEEVMKRSPEFSPGRINAGAVLVSTGHYEPAETLWRSLPGDREHALPVRLWMLKAAVMCDDENRMTASSARLLAETRADEVVRWLGMAESDLLFQDTTLLPAPSRRMAQAISERLNERGRGGTQPVAAPATASATGLRAVTGTDLPPVRQSP